MHFFIFVICNFVKEGIFSIGFSLLSLVHNWKWFGQSSNALNKIFRRLCIFTERNHAENLDRCVVSSFHKNFK